MGFPAVGRITTDRCASAWDGVAAELVLSPNTVGTDVRSIFGKLRVNSRVQMTRAVLQRLSP